jgi:hypothetical protein
MKRYASIVMLLIISAFQIVFSQPPKIDRIAFFSDESILKATLVVNMTNVLTNHKKNGYNINGKFVTALPDGTQINDPVILDVRGHFRMEHCFVPPIRLKFNVKESSVFYSLKSLKLVNECKISNEYEQYLLKEYIVYKIYNLLTDLSFRVRLLNLTFQDSAARKKPINEYAYLMEDIKDLAIRNDFVIRKGGKLSTEATNRKQMTLVAIFEYMIGNTDWAVSVNHNIKLIVPSKDTTARPFSVPYDFDHSGFVNTEYAAPDERLEIENVRQRLYRGYPRSMGELEEVLSIFKQQKTKIYGTVNNFDLLTQRNKKEITDYLDDFYSTINRPDEVKSIFIENATSH